MDQLDPTEIATIGSIATDFDKLIEQFCTVEKYHYSVKPLVSIVMTTHNRIPQTLHTLDTVSKSEIKDLEIIIVDDSDSGFIDPKEFEKYYFSIVYVKIDIKLKKWANPCVNYNIGFHMIKGELLIIQNAEVCHIGDVIKHIVNNLKENQYMIFDVVALKNMIDNQNLYKLTGYNNIKKFVYQRMQMWYHHHSKNNTCFHFLTAMKSSELARLNGGFDLDFACGSCFDDDAFIFLIREVLKMEIIYVKHEFENLFGIHQFHEKSNDNALYHYKKRAWNINNKIMNRKRAIFLETGKYPYFYLNSI